MNQTKPSVPIKSQAQPQSHSHSSNPIGSTTTGGLVGLHGRIRSKIESRCKRPWFELNRDFFISEKGVQSLPDLKKALEHFHVQLSENDLLFLMNTYINQDKAFDWKKFVGALYPSANQTPQASTSHSSSSSISPPSSSVPSAPQSLSSSLNNRLAIDNNNTHSNNNNNNNNNDNGHKKDETHALKQDISHTHTHSDNEVIQSHHWDQTDEEKQYDNKQSSTINTNSTHFINTGKRASFKKSNVFNKTLPSRVMPKELSLTFNRQHHQRLHEQSVSMLPNVSKTPLPYPDHEFKAHGNYSYDQPRFGVKKTHTPTPKK